MSLEVYTNFGILPNIIFLYFSRLISSKYFLIKDIKQLMAGAGVAVVGMVLVPLLSGLFSV
nr:Maff2 family protein [Clostridium sp. AM30-24]